MTRKAPHSNAACATAQTHGATATIQAPQLWRFNARRCQRGIQLLFIFYAVQWGRRAQDVYALQNKIGMVLRGKIHLGTCTLPPSVNDVMVDTGCPKVGCQNPTNKRHLNGSPLNGGSSPTSVETQAVYPSDLTLSFIPQ